MVKNNVQSLSPFSHTHTSSPATTCRKIWASLFDIELALQYFLCRWSLSKVAALMHYSIKKKNNKKNQSLVHPPRHSQFRHLMVVQVDKSKVLNLCANMWVRTVASEHNHLKGDATLKSPRSHRLCCVGPTTFCLCYLNVLSLLLLCYAGLFWRIAFLLSLRYLMWRAIREKNLDEDLTEARFFNGSLFSDSILFRPFFFQTVTSNAFIYSLNSYLKCRWSVCACMYLLCGCVISYFSK